MSGSRHDGFASIFFMVGPATVSPQQKKSPHRVAGDRNKLGDYALMVWTPRISWRGRMVPMARTRS